MNKGLTSLYSADALCNPLFLIESIEHLEKDLSLLVFIFFVESIERRWFAVDTCDKMSYELLHTRAEYSIVVFPDEVLEDEKDVAMIEESKCAIQHELEKVNHSVRGVDDFLFTEDSLVPFPE